MVLSRSGPYGTLLCRGRPGIISPVLDVMIRFRRRWRAALQAGSLLLLLAFLPTTIYVDHWGEMLDYALSQQSTERPHPDHVSHQGHCHGVTSCSDQPQPVGVRISPTVVELPQPNLVSFVVEQDVSRTTEYFISPPTEPPRL